MAIISTGAPRIYLTVTNEDITQVLSYLDAMKQCALDNITKEVSRVRLPTTTTFRFPLPSCMTLEIESTKEVFKNEYCSN